MTYLRTTSDCERFERGLVLVFSRRVSLQSLPSSFRLFFSESVNAAAVVSVNTSPTERNGERNFHFSRDSIDTIRKTCNRRSRFSLLGRHSSRWRFPAKKIQNESAVETPWNSRMVTSSDFLFIFFFYIKNFVLNTSKSRSWRFQKQHIIKLNYPLLMKKLLPTLVFNLVLFNVININILKNYKKHIINYNSSLLIKLHFNIFNVFFIKFKIIIFVKNTIQSFYISSFSIFVRVQLFKFDSHTVNIFISTKFFSLFQYQKKKYWKVNMVINMNYLQMYSAFFKFRIAHNV